MSSSAIAPLPVSEKIKTASDIKLKPILSQGPSIEIKNITVSFKAQVMRMNDAEPSETFALNYLLQAKAFVEFAKEYRERAVLAEK